MTRSGKTFLFLLAGAGILVVLLAALVFLGPRLLNTKAVRDFTLAELERRTGLPSPTPVPRSPSSPAHGS